MDKQACVSLILQKEKFFAETTENAIIWPNELVQRNALLQPLFIKDEWVPGAIQHPRNHGREWVSLGTSKRLPVNGTTQISICGPGYLQPRNVHAIVAGAG